MSWGSRDELLRAKRGWNGLKALREWFDVYMNERKQSIWLVTSRQLDDGTTLIGLCLTSGGLSEGWRKELGYLLDEMEEWHLSRSGLVSMERSVSGSMGGNSC